LPAPSLEDWLSTRVRDVPADQALATSRLLDLGHTVPFIARYRKDETGGLDEAAVRRVLAARDLFERIESRRAAILDAAERQKKKTAAFEEQVLQAPDLTALEDLFLPLRKKKGKTVAAREAGLEPLADWVWTTGHGTETPQEGQTLELWAFTYRNPEKDVPDAESAIAGARALLVERLSEDASLRALARREAFAHAVVAVVKTDKAKSGSKHESVFNLREKATALREGENTHRLFALRRAAHEGEVVPKVDLPTEDPSAMDRLRAAFEAAALTVPEAPGAALLKEAAREALDQHVWPDVAAELLQSLREDADRAAIRPLAEGLRRRLMTPPLGDKPVLGLHPTKDGGVWALVDAGGRFVKTGSLHLAEEKLGEARALLALLAREGSVAAVAVGDGTAGRERAHFVEESLKAAGLDAVVQVVSEAASAAWRASDAAKAEHPDLDPEVRGALSLARRLQDPLVELARAEPLRLAEGPYVHEVSQRLLGKRLQQTMESCLHEVGLDVNRAPSSVLAMVSGVGEDRAKSLVANRETGGAFASRAALRDNGLDEKTFVQAAGFLRVHGGSEPLDATRVHPERYAALQDFATRQGKAVGDFFGEKAQGLREDGALQEAVGVRTLEDVVVELSSPGRDPRGPFVAFRYREDVRRLEDLRPGMVCAGLVTNTASFGAFVDIGVPQDGLVHVSQLPSAVEGQPPRLLLAGDRVLVRVVKLDLPKKQISLSMRGVVERPATPRARVDRASPRKPGAARPTHRPRPAPSRPRPGAGASPVADASANAATVARPGGGTLPKPPTRRDHPRPSPRPESDRRSERPTARSERPAKPHDAKPSAERKERVDRPASGPRPAFNNPFAVLAKLKEPKKD